MKSSHAWVGGSAQRWVLSWIPATKTECTWFFLICCGNRNKIWRDGPECPNTWIWARLGSSFLIFVLSNPVLQKQGELSTLYQCGQQSLKYLLSGPFQKKRKEKFANYCRREEGRVNRLDESFTYQLSWEILAQRRLSKNTSGMQTLQRMSTAGVGFRVRQASLGELELWGAAESWLSTVLTHS